MCIPEKCNESRVCVGTNIHIIQDNNWNHVNTQWRMSCYARGIPHYKNLGRTRDRDITSVINTYDFFSFQLFESNTVLNSQG